MDIKWILKFGFNVKKEDIEKLNKKGGIFVLLKIFEDKVEEKDKVYFEKNKVRKEILDRVEKYFIEKYNLKLKEKEIVFVEKGISFK